MGLGAKRVLTFCSISVFYTVLQEVIYVLLNLPADAVFNERAISEIAEYVMVGKFDFDKLQSRRDRPREFDVLNARGHVARRMIVRDYDRNRLIFQRVVHDVPDVHSDFLRNTR